MNVTQKKSTLVTHALAIGYSKRGKVKKIASAIDLDIREGELVGLVGSNGIGKSTLLRTLSQVQAPLSGTIAIGNTPIDQYAPGTLATQLSLVLTDPIASKNLTVQELVALGRHPYTNWIGKLTIQDKEKINEALTLTQMEGLSKKKCYELSDGQLQKVLIARAIAQDTALIILDEPTTHLDSYHKAYILKLLQKLTRETQKTILFATHEIDLAIQLCDKMILMIEGGIHCASPQKLITKGLFDTLFPKDLIEFDPNLRRFRIK